MIVVRKEVTNITGKKGTIIRSSGTHYVVLISKSDMTYERPQSKEGYVVAQLKQWARDGKLPMYTSHNKRIIGCNFRPDIVFYMPTHAVVLEIDEFQHSMQFSFRSAYNPKNEFQRMCAMGAALGKPMSIIRYNPDSFKISGANCRPNRRKRMDLLLERMMFAMTNPPSDFIVAEYLFYSRVQPSDDNPCIGRFAFSEQCCMTNWINQVGASWDVLTLGEAVELAEDTTGIACEFKPCIRVETTSPERCQLPVLEIIRQVMNLFTESDDPFQPLAKYRTELELILDCTPALDGKGNEIQALSETKTTVLFTLYDIFLMSNPRPWHAVDKVTRLSFLQAIIIFGHITRPILGVDLCRTNTYRGSRNVKRDYLYVMQKV